jgi:hypothetical protein
MFVTLDLGFLRCLSALMVYILGLRMWYQNMIPYMTGATCRVVGSQSQCPLLLSLPAHTSPET